MLPVRRPHGRDQGRPRPGGGYVGRFDRLPAGRPDHHQESRFDPGDEVFTERRSLIFKKLRVVRFLDQKRNTLVYMAYSDKLIDGSPKNSISAVPIMPWPAANPPCQK